uniref:NAD(P)H-quinone oxidoreductase subunit 5, chloroplastic n=1 Tax=Equisetum hyemale TaxID=3262 RepID=M9PK69_EQUHY|nr:NAD(P)H-quinone oxidoreductase subunit 5 [Equisetum hyemale]AGC26671.1 NAD(P)H-quinone oxidoreductase subunit 5 [Equisetum hyemale]
MESLYRYVWIVPLCPFVTSILIGAGLLFFPKAVNSLRRMVAFLSISSLSISMLISIFFFSQEIKHQTSFNSSFYWVVNQQLYLELGFSFDSFISIMLVLVTTIGFLVMIYSDSYMSHDRGYVRFFVYLGLFTASMLGLILSPNLIQLYIFWELVGIFSYLLIGFWFTRPSAANACQKAFITNRIGDFGLLLGILGFYWLTNSFEINNVIERCNQLIINDNSKLFWINLCAILLFFGPVAKSAQFPLHIWLPDAMEGPTPISALIHAATMVAAGIFLVAKMFLLFKALSFTMIVISSIGTITAFLGATIALAQTDLKRGLAYSTMSQLGYMMLALGIGSYQAALFHLITHAYSKALLFLGSGSVIHSLESRIGYSPNKNQNIIFMGGLRKYMPITGITFLLGTLSISGIPPFACFWSKDQIIVSAWSYSPILGVIVSFTAGLTSFYMFRIYFLTFEGDLRIDLAQTLESVNLQSNLQISSSSISEEHTNIYKISSFLGNRIGSNKSFYLSNWIQNLIKNNVQNSLNPSYGSDSKHFIQPKESDWILICPLIILTIPTIFIGFFGSIIFPKLINFDSSLDLSYDSLTIVMNSNYWFDFIREAIPSTIIASVGIVISFIIYGPESFYSRNLRENIDPKLDGILGFLLNTIYNWSYNRAYIDKLYNFVFIRGTRLSAKSISFFDQWVIDGIVNGIGISSFFGGEGIKYGQVGRISLYLFGLILGIISLLIVQIFRFDVIPSII